MSVAVVLFFAFFMPLYHEYAGARRVLGERQTLLADAKAAQVNVINLSRQYMQNETTISKVLLALPKQRQYDYITSSIQGVALTSGMQLTELTIGDAVKNAGDYQSFQVHIALSGRYPELIGFLDALEHSLRLYDISRMEISEGSTSGFLTISIQLTAYSLK